MFVGLEYKEQTEYGLKDRWYVQFTPEGDLDRNGSDEFGIRVTLEMGNWQFYTIYTYLNGEWQSLVEPIRTYYAHYYDELNDGQDVVQTTNQKGVLRVRFSDWRDDSPCLVDTLMKIKYRKFGIENWKKEEYDEE